MTFTDYLLDQILRSGHSRKEIAQLMPNFPKRRLDEICNGLCPSSHEVMQLSRALNVSVDEMEDLISGKESTLEPVKSHFKADLTQNTAPNQLKSDYKTPLQPIKDKTCVISGTPNPERAHYDGPMQHLFGAGTSEKCDNLFVAEISRELHLEYHNPKEPKSIERSHDFLVAILLTIKRKLENGQIIFKK